MSLREGSSQPVGVDPPEVVLATVHVRDRDLLGERRNQPRVAVHVDLQPVGTGFRADRHHYVPRKVTQVAAGTAVQDDSGV